MNKLLFINQVVIHKRIQAIPQFVVGLNNPKEDRDE